MSNNKQSSVEWLAEIIRFANKELYAEMFEKIERAKAMHKEEIIDANFDGQRLHAKSVTNTMMEDNAEQYYNETYESNT